MSDVVLENLFLKSKILKVFGLKFVKCIRRLFVNYVVSFSIEFAIVIV